MRGWTCSLDDTATTENVVQVRSQILLFGGRLRPFFHWGGGRAGCVTHLLRSIGAHLASAAFASFHFTQPR